MPDGNGETAASHAGVEQRMKSQRAFSSRKTEARAEGVPSRGARIAHAGHIDPFVAKRRVKMRNRCPAVDKFRAARLEISDRERSGLVY